MIQQHIHELIEQDWDVIVIGAGPAGSVAACSLAEKGYQTLLLDKTQFPREKICGDGLNHDAVRFLKENGLYKTVRSQAREIPKALVYSTGGIELEVPGPYLAIQRKHFDVLLAKRAQQSGAAFACAHVKGLSQEGANRYAVRCRDIDTVLQARYIILATGAQTTLTKFLGLSTQIFPSTIAVRCYVQSPEKLEAFIGSYDPAVLPGYGWIFPIEEDLYNVGVIAYPSNRGFSGKTLKKRVYNFLENFPIAHNMMKSGKILSPLKGFPLNCGLPKTVMPGRGNLITTGETIGTTFHLTGEGIGKAMETGKLAADVIHKVLSDGDGDVVTAFHAELDRQFRHKYSGYRTAERWLAIPWLNDFLALRMLKSPALMASVIDIIVNERDPREAFSIQGVLRSFWK
jgi:geranylgeranyl reductase family protein